MVNKKMIGLGKQSSAIRELFEYGNYRKQQIGIDKVFDFSLGKLKQGESKSFEYSFLIDYTMMNDFDFVIVK